MARPNILIDDFGKNIASWEAPGGEGFKHKDLSLKEQQKQYSNTCPSPQKKA